MGMSPIGGDQIEEGGEGSPRVSVAGGGGGCRWEASYGFCFDGY